MPKKGKPVGQIDCCAFVQSQTVKCGNFKPELYGWYPTTMIFGEVTLALPWIKEFTKCKTPIAYSYETRGEAKKIYNTFHGGHFLGIDCANLVDWKDF